LEKVGHNLVLLAVGLMIASPDHLRLTRIDDPIEGATFEDELRELAERYLQKGEPGLLDRALTTLVSTAFQRNGANQTHAAEQLGISLHTMRTHLARLGIIRRRASRKHT
jgi:DNA-binding NtrC family response regulator